MSKKVNNKNKKIPSFWWDFEHLKNGEMNLIIESDDDKFPIIARYYLAKEKFADEIINKAEKFIEDLKAGRADYRRSSKGV